MWQVVLRGQVVYMADTKEQAEAKAYRLNRMSPAHVTYVVEEVPDETSDTRQTSRTK